MMERGIHRPEVRMRDGARQKVLLSFRPGFVGLGATGALGAKFEGIGTLRVPLKGNLLGALPKSEHRRVHEGHRVEAHDLLGLGVPAE